MCLTRKTVNVSKGCGEMYLLGYTCMFSFHGFLLGMDVLMIATVIQCFGTFSKFYVGNLLILSSIFYPVISDLYE